VWDGTGEDVNVVEVYVGYLRRKLGREAVETVRGAGYRVAG
jgi:DNA-binding response OmpR family regulator